MNGEIRYRHPVEADHPGLVRQMNEWWGGTKLQQRFPRLWLQHFTGTSWLAEDSDGRSVGFLVGFVSPDRPDEAYVHLIGTSPNHRRMGIGRELYRHFFHDATAHGARRVTAVTWPGNRASLLFHRALGFATSEAPGTKNLYGSSAFPDYDADREDRVVLSLDL